MPLRDQLAAGPLRYPEAAAVVDTRKALAARAPGDAVIAVTVPAEPAEVDPVASTPDSVVAPGPNDGLSDFGNEREARELMHRR